MGMYAEVDSTGEIVNIVQWDGEGDWTPQDDGVTAVKCESQNAQIGGSYLDGIFSAPPVPALSVAELIAAADSQKSALLADANTYTQPWQTQLLLGIITDSDKASLTSWMTYYQNLQAVDTSTAPNITWPKLPS